MTIKGMTRGGTRTPDTHEDTTQLFVGEYMLSLSTCRLFVLMDGVQVSLTLVVENCGPKILLAPYPYSPLLLISACMVLHNSYSLTGTVS